MICKCLVSLKATPPNTQAPYRFPLAPRTLHSQRNTLAVWACSLFLHAIPSFPQFRWQSHPPYEHARHSLTSRTPSSATRNAHHKRHLSLGTSAGSRFPYFLLFKTPSKTPFSQLDPLPTTYGSKKSLLICHVKVYLAICKRKKNMFWGSRP